MFIFISRTFLVPELFCYLDPPVQDIETAIFWQFGPKRPKLDSTVKMSQNHKMVTMSGANRVFLWFFCKTVFLDHSQAKETISSQKPTTRYHAPGGMAFLGPFGPLGGPWPVGPVGGPISQCGWTFGWNVLGTLFEGLHMGYPYIHILPLNSPPTRRYNQIF